MLPAITRDLLLRGNVVHPDGSVRDRYVLVRDGRIAAVARRRPALTQDVAYVEAGREDWIFPGLLNLHTHASYNLLPLWQTAMTPFANRFEWRGLAEYQAEVRGTYEHFKKQRMAVAVFAELQAVAGGTTVMQEACDLDREARGADGLILCRDTRNPEDLGLAPDQQILSVVDWFRPGKDGTPKPVTKAIAAYLRLRGRGALAATIVHLAEGCSGFGTYRGVDAYSRREFEAFMAHPAFKDAAAVRSSPLVLAHGSGIDVRDSRHIAFLRERGISIVWSPVSNLLLYGDTLDVDTLLAEGINVALGSDWAPSGSKHVWDEAKFARRYIDAIGSSVGDEQIFQMVTTNPARCLGLPHLGRIEVGGFGDFFILKSPLESDSPLEVFLSTTDRHVRATIVGGRPLYGDRELLAQFNVKVQRLPKAEGSAVKEKTVHLPPEIKVDVDRDLTAIEKILKALSTPVKRSNLLSDSDKLYRRRIHALRETSLAFGWRAQVWRRSGQAREPGRFAVPPDAVRVWRGVRADGVSRDAFRVRMGQVFIPAAVQTQAPLGLTACLPTVLPIDRPDGLPDEIALAFYESKEVYGRTPKATTAGRTYSLLHGAVFSLRASRSGFPSLLGAELRPDVPYHLFTQPADWYVGECRLLIGIPPAGTNPPAFRATIHRLLHRLQGRPPKDLDGAIVVATDQYLLYWEHWRDKCPGPSAVSDLSRLVKPVMTTTARPERVASDAFAPYPGLTIPAEGDSLNLQFERRALLPW